MAFTFDATISGASANSYTLVTDADDYFGGSVNGSLWSALSTAVKEQYLVMATVRLESEMFGGYPATATQRLQFPRSNLISRYADDYLNEEGQYPTDIYYPDDSIPKEIQEAQFEVALYFIKKATGALGTMDEIDLEHLKSLEVGPLKMMSRDGFMEEELPAKVKRMLTACGPNTWMSGSQRTAVRG